MKCILFLGLALGISPLTQTSEPPVLQTALIASTAPTLLEITAAKLARAFHDNGIEFEIDGTKTLEENKEAIMKHIEPFNQPHLRNLIAQQYKRLYPEKFETRLIQSIDNAHIREVSSLIFSPDGNLMASASDDNVANSYDHTIKIWIKDGNQFRLLQTIDNKSPASAIAFSPDGKYLASAADIDAKIWTRQNDDTFQIFQTLTPQSLKRVDAIAFSPDGSSLALKFGEWNSWAHIYSKQPNDLFIKRQTFSFCHGERYTSTLTFTPSGELITTSLYSGIQIWRQNEQGQFMKRQHILREGIQPMCKSTICSPNNDYFVHSAGTGPLNICLRQADNTFTKIQIPEMAGRKLTFGNNNLLAVSNGASTHVWSRNNNNTFKLVQTLTVPDGYPFTQHRGQIASIALSSQHDLLAVGTDNGISMGRGAINIWNNVKPQLTHEQIFNQLLDKTLMSRHA